jgi:pimeloyl-ACP methyl ester carboxylesterase/DNA-binding CsgD family transcriptional regulator
MPSGKSYLPQVRFCTARDGVRIAYSIGGSGPALINVPHGPTHLEYEWQSPIWQPWLTELSREYTMLRFDLRGCGLSDPRPDVISFDACVDDLEAVIDAAGFDRFALFGHMRGGALAIAYAARHPEQVSHVVLLGGFARGRLRRDPTPREIEDVETRLKLIELGWTHDDPAYRLVFAHWFMPKATLEQQHLYCQMLRKSAAPDIAVQILRAFYMVDVREIARRITCPALVLHARGAAGIPFEEGRLIASLIPEARLVPLETDNHILLPSDPAWGHFFSELRDFLPRDSQRAAVSTEQIAALTARERDVLELIAEGMDNAQIAARLGLSEKTVRNHITNVFDKIQVENRSQAIVRARDAGFGRRAR